MVGFRILAVSNSHDGIWRKAELESWDDKLSLGEVVFRDDGSSAKLGGDSLSLSEYAQMSENEESPESCSDDSESSYEEEDEPENVTSQGLGFLEATAAQCGVQTDTAVFAKWEHHTRGIASKMMASMGYREGMGLGVSGQGIVDPILVKVLPRGQSLGYELKSSKVNKENEGRKKKRSRGGKRVREKKFAAAARAAKAKEENQPDVFNFINHQLAMQSESQNGLGKKQREGYGEGKHEKKEDRRSLVAYDDEVKELRNKVDKLEEMMRRNSKEKAVYDAASRKLEEIRKALADAEATHASASNAVVSKEKEKKWLKF